ncbi:MAG: 30S ribosome-binding factor RbfA [Candidatus Bruticola sp.]
MNHHLVRLRGLMLEVGNEIIHRVKDPSVFPPEKEGQEIITLTDVDLSADTSLAKFYISIMAPEDRQIAIVEGLNKAKGFLRHELAKELCIKNIPSLAFFRDTTQEKAEHIFSLLESLNIDQDNQNQQPEED